MSSTRLNPSYQMDIIKSSGEKSSLEVAGPLIMESFDQNQIDPFITENDYLFLQAEIKTVKEGNPASNLRFPNKNTNNIVVENIYNLYKIYQRLNENPVVITSYPRNQRYISFKMNEDGTFTITNKKTNDDYHEILNQFLESCNITKEMIKIIRQSSERAKYNTYMADIISFLLKVNYFHMPELFEEKNLTPEIVESIDERFNDIIVNDQSWRPKDGFNSLYYSENYNKNVTQKFMIPKSGTIDKIYYQMWNLLSNQDNGIKLMIRHFFTNSKIVQRWSDYWESDVDDWFTILAIINAFKYTTLTNQEEEILKQLQLIVEPIYEIIKK
jgi:hypothetical protein